MVKISRADKRFTCLETKALSQANILERKDLQEYILNSFKPFCQELGEGLMIIAKEVRPSETVADRIDLLAVDDDGNVVIIELKRGNDKLQLLQAIAYAGMIAKWSPEELLAQAGKDRADEIRERIDDLAMINRSQRILLVAEAYDYEVLIGAEWLYKGGVEIDCVRVALAVDGAAEYLTFTQVFPTPELAEQARKRGSRGKAEASAYASWEDAFSASTNKAAVEFFKSQLSIGSVGRLRDHSIVLPVGNDHKFRVRLCEKHAKVKLLGRFADDLAFWQARLSPPATVYAGLVAGKESVLRLHLQTPEDFAAFKKAIGSELQNVKWDDADSAQAASAV
jgi:hypothetical protein